MDLMNRTRHNQIMHSQEESVVTCMVPFSSLPTSPALARIRCGHARSKALKVPEASEEILPLVLPQAPLLAADVH